MVFSVTAKQKFASSSIVSCKSTNFTKDQSASAPFTTEYTNFRLLLDFRNLPSPSLGEMEAYHGYHAVAGSPLWRQSTGFDGWRTGCP